MDALTQAAAARIRAAVDPCPVGKNCFPGVLAQDVVRVGATLAAPSQVVQDLVKGAERAMQMRGSATRTVHQDADQLRHLLESAGV